MTINGLIVNYGGATFCKRMAIFEYQRQFWENSTFINDFLIPITLQPVYLDL